MYWIEICTDGSYLWNHQEFSISTESLEVADTCESARSGNDWARIVTTFQAETEHGVFSWDVEIIEYLELGVASFIGYSLTHFPEGVVLKDEVTFQLQDGWLNPPRPKPRLVTSNG